MRGGPANNVQRKSTGEEQHKGDRQRILVELECPSATPHRPWRAGVVSKRARVAVDVLALADFLRLRGPTLIKEGRQEHVARHLEELALPVFRRRFEETAGEEIL